MEILDLGCCDSGEIGFLGGKPGGSDSLAGICALLSPVCLGVRRCSGPFRLGVRAVWLSRGRGQRALGRGLPRGVVGRLVCAEAGVRPVSARCPPGVRWNSGRRPTGVRWNSGWFCPDGQEGFGAGCAISRQSAVEVPRRVRVAHKGRPGLVRALFGPLRAIWSGLAGMMTPVCRSRGAPDVRPCAVAALTGLAGPAGFLLGSCWVPGGFPGGLWGVVSVGWRLCLSRLLGREFGRELGRELSPRPVPAACAGGLRLAGFLTGGDCGLLGSLPAC